MEPPAVQVCARHEGGVSRILHRIAESHAQLECLRWINDNVDLEGVASLYTAGADAVLVELSDGASMAAG